MSLPCVRQVEVFCLVRLRHFKMKAQIVTSGTSISVTTTRTMITFLRPPKLSFSS